MKNQDYTTTIVVDHTPEEAFDAINDPRNWWAGVWSAEINGDNSKVGAEFTYRVPEVHYCRMKVTELVPGKKVVWHVLDSNISYTETKTEWNNTDICFDITRKDNKTEVRFTHVGLYPDYECYDSCSNAWGALIGSRLRALIDGPKTLDS